MFFFHPRIKAAEVDRKEVLIQHNKKVFNRRIASDLEKIDKINKVLGNGITLSIGKAVGAEHR